MSKVDYYIINVTRGLPKPLRDWLTVATDGLGRIGITRVVEEISAHYYAGLKQLADEAVSPLDASNATIQSFGCAKKARKRFRRMYLTRREERRIRNAIAPKK